MSSFSEGQTHQLMNKLEAAGWTAKHITKFGQFKYLQVIKDIFDGRAVVGHFEDIIRAVVS